MLNLVYQVPLRTYLYRPPRWLKANEVKVLVIGDNEPEALIFRKVDVDQVVSIRVDIDQSLAVPDSNDKPV